MEDGGSRPSVRSGPAGKNAHLPTVVTMDHQTERVRAMSDHAQTSVCPEKVVLRALLDGSLPTDQLAAVQAHADGCASCEASLKQMTVGGESWIGMAASLKERDEQTDGPLAAAMERLKTDDGSGDGDGDRDETDPQRTLDFLQPAEDPKLLGKLGLHEITEVIGWGGMGVVLKAYDPSLHRVVAVKVLASHLAHHAVARKRFIREAQAAAAVCHDNVVTIHAIEDGVADASRIGLPTRDASATLPKIIMQFVAGGSLQERIDQDGPLELKEVLRIAMQTAAGLAAAHAQGVVHRDVKPANILLENGVQRVKLTDFGLARVMDDASLTLSGVIAGTPQYMASEQAWGRDVDARADLFSLGAVMYAMCSGHSPFRARTTMAVLKRVCEDSPRPLRAINPDVPDWLVAIIEKLLAKNPDERFQAATEVSELLGRWLAHVQQPTVAPAPGFVASPSDGTVPPQGGTTNFKARSDASVAMGTTARGQLPVKFLLLPLVVTWVLLGLFLALVIAETGTRNVASFLGFSAFQLLATFVLASVFRAAWNSTSWVVWIASLLFLPFVASLFGYAASYRDAVGLVQWMSALQALSAVAYWLALLFVRPLFAQESDPHLAAQPFRWRRVLALSSILLVPVMASVIWLKRTAEVNDRIDHDSTRAATVKMPADPMIVPAGRDPRRPQIDDRGFPRGQLLSNNAPNLPIPKQAGNVSSSVGEPLFDEILANESTDGLTPPARQENVAAPSAVAESLKPLQGRWVVLTLQGDEPPEVVSPTGGEAGAMGSGMASAAMMRGSNSSVVTPTQSDQLRFLEFRNGVLFLNNDPQRQMMASIQNDRELYLTSGPMLAWHGVFTIADDRLVICWTSGNQPLPRGFQPKPQEQLLVCRREWSRLSHTDDKGNVAVEKLDENSKLPKAEMPFSPREAAVLQAAWAEKLKSPVEVTNSVDMKLRVIPPGSFGDPRTIATLAQSVGGASGGFGSSGGMMGSSDSVAAGGAAGVSTVGRPRSGERGYGALNLAMSGPILVGTREVTIAQFRQFVEDSKYVTEAERLENGQPAKPHSWRRPEIEQDSDQHPVVHVSFEDALAFCHWLSEKEKKPYRLLTRREWEFCARAGSWLPATLGPGKLPYRSQFFTTTAAVGSYASNSFGLHDFIGNVAEWAWHSDVPEGTDARRTAPNTMIWSTDPTVFCGGDFRQHINRSQPNEWLHPAATTTPPITGFRVACDLTAASVVTLPKYWPMSQLFLSQELVLVRTLTNADSKGGNKVDGMKLDVSTAAPAPKLVNAVWLEMLVRAEQMPYAVEWLDFEIERRATPIDETANDLVHGKIEDAGAEAGWKPLDLALTLGLLEQTEIAPDPIVTPLQNHVLTMPIPKAVSGQWASPDARRGLHSSLVRLEPAIQKPQLFRFLDLNAPHGNHYYRVRLKYRAPGITPETVQTTGWFLSMDEAKIDFDALDQSKLPENTPVIELRSKRPANPALKQTE